MKNTQFVRQIAMAITTFGLVAILFSSCHRKSGCPATQNQRVDITDTYTPDDNC